MKGLFLHRKLAALATAVALEMPFCTLEARGQVPNQPMLLTLGGQISQLYGNGNGITSNSTVSASFVFNLSDAFVAGGMGLILSRQYMV